MSAPGLRRRLFWTLFLAALVPAALTLALGALLLREVVASTGSAGPWAAVAESGRNLLELVQSHDPPPDVARAAEEHRDVLSESLRLSQIYALLGQRVTLLIPAIGLFLLALVGLVAGAATRRLARTLAAPAEELAEWIRRLGAGEPLPDERRGGADVAEFRQLRRGLREAADQLQQARRRELERARLESWTEMARRVAHEIKNPLSPMRMAAERVARSPDPATAEAGTVLLEEIRHLDDLARSFARFARPVQGRPAPVDLQELLGGLLHRLEVEGVPIEAELPEESVVVTGHLDALERAVRNLVVNAIEAQGSDHPEPVRVRLTREGESAVVSVEDRGPGIPEEHLDRIWEPDFTTRRKGTGLGLPLVRQTARILGGRAEARNRQGGGARFALRLPLEQAGDQAPGPEADGPRRTSPSEGPRS